MACMFTFDNATCSLEVSREGSELFYEVRVGGAERLYKCMHLREMLWLLQVTPQMLRGLADELEPANEEAVSWRVWCYISTCVQNVARWDARRMDAIADMAADECANAQMEG